MADTLTDSTLTPQPCIPCTHTSPTIIQLFKNLSLPNILQKNKKIEGDNNTRSAKTLNHALDPAHHLQPGSEAASLITIDPEDLAQLRIPSFFASVHEHIYNSLARCLADDELKEKEEKKRKDDDILVGKLRLSKRWCMDGTNHVERVVGEPIPTEFSQALYDTEICIAVPLPFFLTQNLCTLIDEASTLPTVKSNPAPGETKGIYILNIDKLSTRFGKELSLTCSQWSEAATNMEL
ncbi:uncharacterized protein LACBIDRAFT_334387 [Laccaria bicolor S238N-H82]|uniref:Predicted protein n=1 Tax=Laccaria bicolor (strain S238N-H82 / ATCC MYA-4686) TaxID=486041 RepID=B0DZ21_LACBS|nr:uncharacterized protein LACBIDRAFT_334387 [Laccaria bicolor S238N-H82]EDR00156.1 predicted protein [Laccaria bicolor S238N-H82]|eukprot:XP_001889213.1 predicted protein [Laccaria bicolor S238N-H82]